MSKMKIYLAGKMSGLTHEEMNYWRLLATEWLKLQSDNQIHTINPVDYYNFEMNPDTYTNKEVRDFDLRMVKISDLVLVNLDHPDSIGTAIELHMANEWGIPVIGFGNSVNHPWIELNVNKRCDDLGKAVDYIVEYYLPNI